MGISYRCFNSLSYKEKEEFYNREDAVRKRHVDAILQVEKRAKIEKEKLEIKRLDYLITKTDFYKKIMEKLGK
jgi:hypothetical protein